MKPFSLLQRFRDVSISNKLYIVVGVMVLLITVELFTLWFAVNTLSSVRAFVGGEGLWSKAQKDAMYSLRRYARTGDEADYREYLDFLKVNMGDRKARLEMAKENPDMEVIRQGFIEGRNHPDDIDGMINLFRRFHRIYYINKAINIWAAADSGISRMQEAGEHLHNTIRTKGISSTEEAADNFNEINRFNRELTMLEDEFSATLGEGSRWLENLILKILLAIALTVEISGLVLTISISRNISKGIDEIMRVVKQVANGNYKERARIYAKDEIGQLAFSFNSMTGELAKKVRELENAEIHLKENEEGVRTIFNNAPDAVVVINEAGAIVQWNPRAEAIFGWTSNEVIGKLLHETIIPERFRKAHQEGLKHYLRSGEGPVLNKPLELPALRKDGIEFDAGISISPTVIRESLYFIGFVSDISYRKKSENLLKESETKFRGLLESAPDAIVIVNLTDKIIMVNAQTENLFGYTKEEMIGKDVEMLIPHGLYDKHPENRDKLKDDPKIRSMSLGLELFGVNKRGYEFPVEISLSPLQTSDGLIVTAAIRDVTAKKKIEGEILEKSEELLRSNKEMEQFAYITSHDLQEPLRTITNYVGLFQKEYQDKLDKKSDTYLKYINRATGRMQTLIRDLLDYSRIGSDKNVGEVDCNLVLEEVLHDLDAAIKESKADIKAEPLPILKGYSGLKSLFQNLISNGVKFRKADAPLVIRISAKAGPRAWLFAVEDNGIGIEEVYQDRIFTIFQKLHSQADYPGTGIGLAHCKKIVELHHGKMWVESKPEKGSIFYFTIPKNNSA